jgi:hypothetical protein|nr:MAG TPA: hypothetical protein [Caudoviricetes sp.]
MSIRTYAVNCNDAWLNTEGDEISGSYVKYRDHQEVVSALEAKCAALAAELNVVEAIRNDAVFITDGHYEQCPPEVQKIIRSLAVMQIPAYKAFLAEVRAQGVEMFAALLTELDISCTERGALTFATQLRQEAAQ